MVESEEHELISPAFVHGGLEPAKDWHPIGIKRA
jgi:hypothetical protein